MTWIGLRSLQMIQDVQAEAALKLLMETFDRDSLEPESQLRDEINQIYGLPVKYWIAEDEEGLAGVMRWVYLEEAQAVFVIHLVTPKEKRGQGIGQRLLEEVRATYPDVPVLLETDPDDESATWWRKRGAWTVSSTYRQPALHADTGPIPFHLMAIGDVRNPAGLVRSFYAEAWGRSGDDDLVQEALRGLPKTMGADDQDG